MAEPFGIAASAFQVAGAGIELANTLKAYIDSVRKAEKQLKPIADHVKLTSDVLTNVGTLLKNEDIRNLYTKELLGSTENALDGCRKAFEDLEKFISKMLKQSEGGKMTIQAKYTFYFKQKELDVLQAHLERFKSSLDLVLGVLNLAHSAKTAKYTSAIAEMKLDIQRLIQAEHEAKKKEAALATPPPEADISRELADGLQSEAATDTTRDVLSFPAMTTMVDTGSTARALDNTSKQIQSTTNSTNKEPTSENTVLEYLHQCAEAAQKLTADIEKAISKWHGKQEYEHKCLLPAFQTTMQAIDALSKHEDKSAKASNPPPPYAGRDSVQSSDRIKEQFSVIHREGYIERDRSQQPPKAYTTVKRYQGPEAFPRSSTEDDIARKENTFERERPPKIRDDGYLHWQLERERGRDRADAGWTGDYDIERYQRTTDYYADHSPQPIIIREQSRYSQPIMIRDGRWDDDYFYEHRLPGRTNTTLERAQADRLEGLDDSSDDERKSGCRESDISVLQRGFGTRIQECSQAGTVEGEVIRWRRSYSKSRSRSRSLDQIRRHRHGSMSRSRSRSRLRGQVEGLAGVASVGALTGYALKNKDDNTPIATDARLPSRIHSSTGSYQSLGGASTSPETEHLNRRLSQTDLASAAVAGERERMHPMSRERNRSRERTNIPIASAGLGGVATGGLYEEKDVSKTAKRYKVLELESSSGLDHPAAEHPWDAVSDVSSPAWVIDDPPSERRENSIGIAEPPPGDNHMPNGILKKPVEKFPESTRSALNEGIGTRDEQTTDTIDQRHSGHKGPKKKRVMNLEKFLSNQRLGSWGDEMNAPSANGDLGTGNDVSLDLSIESDVASVDELLGRWTTLKF